MTTVSVVVPVYNHEAFVAEGLRSVDAQGHGELEVICVDDGSSDASVEVVATLASQLPYRLVHLVQPNAGAHAALNRGVDVSSGELVMFLNSDDRYGRARVRTFARTWELAGRPADFWGFSCVSFIGEDGGALDPAPLGLGSLSQYNHQVALATWVPELLPWHNVALTSGNLVVTRSLLARVGPFTEHGHVHDWDMALRLLAQVQPVIIPLPLYEYRLHGTNSFSAISVDQSERESVAVRGAYREALLRRSVDQPYAVAGTPAVDFLRHEALLHASFTGD